VSEQQQNAIVSDDQVRASMAAAICWACDGGKTVNAAFCRTCFAALTIWQRGQISQGFAHPDFADVFRSALRHLQLNRERRRRVPNTADEWRHASIDDLQRAGFTFLEMGQCRAPQCLARIAWWRTPAGGQVPVNPSDCQPHRATCRQPEYFRRPIAQTSARRRG
jgi:hypothetical protein